MRETNWDTSEKREGEYSASGWLLDARTSTKTRLSVKTLRRERRIFEYYLLWDLSYFG